jgi:hypothetical protein
VLDGGTIYIGGSFTHVAPPTGGGQPRKRIAALDAASGLATAWNPNANDVVSSLAVSETSPSSPRMRFHYA